MARRRAERREHAVAPLAKSLPRDIEPQTGQGPATPGQIFGCSAAPSFSLQPFGRGVPLARYARRAVRPLSRSRVNLLPSGTRDTVLVDEK